MTPLPPELRKAAEQRTRKRYRVPRNEPRAPDEHTRLIPLTRGLYATVDVADFDMLMQWNWAAMKASRSRTFYAVRHSLADDRKTILMHRQVLNPSDDMHVDHVDHDGLNNRRANLRQATQSQNKFNRKAPRTNKSGYKGVYFSKRDNKWIAQIGLNGKSTYLGLFDDPAEAHAAYVEAARKIHGEFAYLGAALSSTGKGQ